MSNPRSDLDALQRLKDSPDFAVFKLYINENASQLERECLNPLSNSDEVFIREFQKGHARGLRGTLDLLDPIISSLEGIIALEEAERIEHENQVYEEPGDGLGDPGDGSNSSGDDSGGSSRAP